MQSAIMGTSVPVAIATDRCASCKNPATHFKNEVSRKEFAISGLCQRCQDQVFGQEDGECSMLYEEGSAEEG